MSHWAAPGVKCVCIKRDKWKREGSGFSLARWFALLWLGLPVCGGTYVVTEARSYRGHVYLRLKGYGTVWFLAQEFRPAVDPKVAADLALFTPLLDPSHPRIPEDAPAKEGAQ